MNRVLLLVLLGVGSLFLVPKTLAEQTPGGGFGAQTL